MIAALKSSEKWKWLFQPLDKRVRARLEITLGVVATGAAMVALSTVVPPDPAKLLKKLPVVSVPSEAELRADGHLRRQEIVNTNVPPELAAAIASGDIATMDRLYTPKTPLTGMLSVASEAGHVEAVRWLLEHGVDIHESEGTVDAPIIGADAHPAVVALLLEKGAFEATLVISARAGALNTVTRLLAKKVDPNPSDGSPLNEAIGSARATPATRRAIVEKLLAAKSDPNKDDIDTPLGAAVRTCDTTADADGNPTAAVDDCLSLIHLLIKHGARAKGDALSATFVVDDTVRDKVLDAVLTAKIEKGATAQALTTAYSPSERGAKLLIAKGVDWAWRDGEDDAALPLFSAVSRGDRDFVKTLLDAGAPVNQHYKDGSSALGEAIDQAGRGNGPEAARMVELLIARGADVNRRFPDGRTPLFAAAETGEIRIVNVLLARGARPNDRVLDDTALDAAESNGHVPAARVLHAHGGRRGPKLPPRMGDQ